MRERERERSVDIWGVLGCVFVYVFLCVRVERWCGVTWWEGRVRLEYAPVEVSDRREAQGPAPRQEMR